MPLRTCVSCRTKGEKKYFDRFVAGAEGPVADESGKAAGRGAYVCREKDCLEQAVANGTLARALRIKRANKSRVQ